MRPYVVRQGDYLTRLAVQHGFDADEVWSHESNRDLRERRPNRDMLAPGDILHLPERDPRAAPFRSGGTRRYQARVPKVPVRIVLRSGREPIRDEPFVVTGAGRTAIEGTSDGEGVIRFEVPVHVTEVYLRLPRSNAAYPVLVGHMDPLEEESGVRARLEHLGYLSPPLRDVLARGPLGPLAHRRDTIPEPPDDALEQAVRRFQTANGLEATGAVDDATRDALRRAHDGAGGGS